MIIPSRITYSMYLFRISIYFMMLVWLNYRFAKSVRKHILEGRVLGGKNVTIRDYPHAVFIQIFRKDWSSHICGSSVLNQKFLLTAAHCFDVKHILKTVAFAGHENIKKSRITRAALEVKIHEQFNLQNDVRNDIALILLKRELPLNARIKRIIIKRSFPRYVTGTLAGWGLINEKTLKETDLLQLVNQKVRYDECKLIKLRPGTFCAGSLKSSNPTPSLGDSGSGLITNKFQLIGILSYKMTKYPALPVYTNASYFYSWINKLTNYCYCKLEN